MPGTLPERYAVNPGRRQAQHPGHVVHRPCSDVPTRIVLRLLAGGASADL